MRFCVQNEVEPYDTTNLLIVSNALFLIDIHTGKSEVTVAHLLILRLYRLEITGVEVSGRKEHW
jgi:hypothetical protein